MNTVNTQAEVVMSSTHVDVLIIGAGISGIGAAYHLQKHCPDKSYAIIEERSAVGGTWDLFRYPGIRSDSDMYTFGFNFKPWTSSKTIAPGDEIREYIAEAASENGIDKHIVFERKVVSTSWCSKTALWTTQVENLASGEIEEFTSRLFYSCAGYYNYSEGFTPEFKNAASFSGQLVHPQHWPQDLDYTDKNIVVIGSGATAITLVPALAQSAAKVTMLQRSPTYMASRPSEDALSNLLRRVLPAKLAYSINRWRSVMFGIVTYRLAKAKPERLKHYLIGQLKKALGSEFDVKKHFTPSYKPWDQRICAVTDGDLFEAINNGSADVVTDHIESFNSSGIALKSGQELKADIIVTATGLKAELLQGFKITVDNAVINPADHYCYKGMMLSGLPNFVLSMGYTNASWTLKSDLVSEYVCRILKHMDKQQHDFFMPALPTTPLDDEPIVDFSSGYITRALKMMPKQAKQKPWKLHQNYILDRITLGYTSVNDDCMTFNKRGAKPA